MNLNSKIVILIWLVFDFEFMTEQERYAHYYFRDLYFCATCFRRTEAQCERLFNTVEYDPDITTMQRLNGILPRHGKRETRILRLKNTEGKKVIAKALASNRQYEILASNLLTRSVITNLFFDKVRVQDLQFCPTKSTHYFVDYMETQNDNDELTAWLYMLINVQPILNPYLYGKDFPVPKTLATCGFTTFQEYAGQPMTEFYDAPFGIKLRIAIQLLQGVMKFSNGFNRYRLFITDLTTDNVVYNVERDKLYFVDLDSLLIVDADNARNRTDRGSIHKYEYIPCNDCFAYVQQDICEMESSDFVIFQACQLLREDLRGDRTKGFLYSIPKEIKEFFFEWDHFMDLCVDCPKEIYNCQHRFAAATDLIWLFRTAINEFGL